MPDSGERKAVKIRKGHLPNPLLHPTEHNLIQIPQGETDAEVSDFRCLHAGNFDGEGDSANTNGWDTSATANFSKHFGVTSDFSGSYKTESVTSGGLTGTAAVRIYTYTFGPAVSYRSGDYKVFAHALFGGAHVRPTGCVIFSGSPDECGSGGASGFAMMLGGGLDVRAGKSLALRLVQFDWMRLPSEFGAQNNNWRASTGLVFRF